MEVPPITTDCPQCKPLNDQLLAIIAQQQAQINALQARLEKVERAGKRQAAPFRKKAKADPKKPGRKSGDEHGEHHRRRIPERICQTQRRIRQFGKIGWRDCDLLIAGLAGFD